MQSTSQPKLSEREIAEAWAKITIQLWRKNLSRMKIDKKVQVVICENIGDRSIK